MKYQHAICLVLLFTSCQYKQQDNILHSLDIVNSSLQHSTSVAQEASYRIYSDFEAVLLGLSEKQLIWKTKIEQVRLATHKSIEYIDSLEHELLAGNSIENQENTLVSKIEALNGLFISAIDTTTRNKSVFSHSIKYINSLLDTNTDSLQIFNNNPVTMLRVVSNNIRNAELELLQCFVFQIGTPSFAKSSFSFHKLQAMVVPESDHVVLGNEYKAGVFMVVWDSTAKPDVYTTGSTTLLPVEYGKGIYKHVANSVGQQSWSGAIKMKHPSSGEELSYPFKAEYQVTEPCFTMSLTKMNVVYIGIENPIDIAVANVRPQDITVSVSGGGGGKIEKVGGNSYVVKATTPTLNGGELQVNVTAKIGGKQQYVGSRKFRVKPLPDPVPMVGSYKGGIIAKNELIQMGGIKAVVINIDVCLNFDIVSFNMSATVAGVVVDKKATGPRFTTEQVALLSSLESGQKVYIEDILARGPEGAIRDLGALAFVIK